MLLVIACHWWGIDRGSARFSPLGSTGVTLFFVLSGFLITSLLVEEHATRGRVWFAAFYRNRTLRLAPALFALVAVLWLLDRWTGARTAPIVPVLFYVANWAQAGGQQMGVLGHAWSLAIEEQFYLVWPAVLLLSMRRRWGPLVVTTVGIAVSTGLRFQLAGGVHPSIRAYYGSDTQAASLLIGCLLALLAHRGLPPLRVPAWLLTAVTLSLFGAVLTRGLAVSHVLVPTIVPWIGAALIWAACCGPGGWLSGAFLGYVGRRSYGLYLWHYPAIALVATATRDSLAWGACAVALTVGIAEVSWRFVERPMLRLKAHRLGEVGVVDGVPARPVVVLP